MMGNATDTRADSTGKPAIMQCQQHAGLMFAQNFHFELEKKMLFLI